MSLQPETLGAPVTDLDDYVATRTQPTCRPEPEPAAFLADDAHTGPVRRFWWIGPVLALVMVGAWMLARGSAPLPAPSPSGVIAPPPGLTGFAEMYVTAYLTGAEESALRSFTVDPSATRVRPYQRYVASTAAVGLTEVGSAYWTVTIAADVLPKIDGGYGPRTIEYFEVAAAAVGSGYLATGAPLPVPAPVATVPYGVYAEPRSEADDTTLAFVQEFLDAYLAGSGRLPRLVTPDSGISPVAPTSAQNTAVTAVRVGDIDGRTWAVATAVATRVDGSALPITIAVRLVPTPDGVRVAEILPGPPPLPATAG